MKRFQVGGGEVVFAVCAAAALSLRAADGIWGRTDNTDVVNPVAWSNAANWAGGVIAGEGGHAYFTNAYPDKVVRAVEIPPEGVTLNRFWFKNNAIQSWSGAYLYVSGGPMRMQQVGGVAPRIDSDSDYPHIFAEIQGTDGLTCSPNWGIHSLADNSYTGLTTVESGYWITRFDGVANSADPVLYDYASTNDYLLNGGRLTFYGRKTTTATVTSNWALVEGEVLATFVSGSNANSLTPGSHVTGEGVPEGAFIKRIIGATYVLLSAPATASVNSAALVFAPVASECYQRIDSVESRHNNSELVVNRNSADVMRVEIGALKGTANVLHRVSGGQTPGVLAIRNARSFGGVYNLNAGILELLRDGETQPALSNLTVVADSTLHVPEADAVADVAQLTGSGTTLTKTGAGTLAAGLGFGSTLSLVVEGGTVALPRPSVTSLLAEASLRLDASRAETLTLDAEGRVSRWADADGRANAVSNTVVSKQPVRVVNALNGLPVIDFGPYYGTSASGCGLFMEERKTNVLSAFLVYYGRHPEAVMLGEQPGVKACAFTRSSNPNNRIWSNSTSGIVKNGTTALDGIPVPGGTTELPTNEFHLVSVVNTEAATAGALSNDRNYRSGGQQLAEVILFDRKLTALEQASVDHYLMEKWFGAAPKRQLGKVTLQNGTRWVLPYDEEVVVNRLSLNGEVWIEGPGRLQVTDGISQSGTVHVVNGGGIITAGVGGLSAPPVPAVAGNPVFWVDACALTNAGAEGVVLENGTNFVVRWNDVRGAGYNFATNNTRRPTLRLNDINGLPSVYIKRVTSAYPSESEALFWDQPVNDIRAVFMVLGSQDGGGILLGSSAAENTADFFRNYWADSGKPILYPTTSAAVLRDGLFFLNGYPIDPTVSSYNGLFQVVEAHPTGPVRASAFAADRNRLNDNGCQRLCEVIVYNRELSDAERYNTADYLMRKWFGRGTPYESSQPGFNEIAAENDFTLEVLDPDDVVTVGRFSGSGDLVKTGEGTAQVNSLEIAGQNVDVREGVLRLNAGDASDRIPAGAFLHVDASRTNTLVFNPAKGPDAVEEWRDCAGGANFARRRLTDSRRPCPNLVTNALNGLPVIDFGELKTGSPATELQCFFEWDQPCSNIWDAFVVIGSAAGGNVLLGAKSSVPRHFRRTVSSDFTKPVLDGNSSALLSMGETRINGRIVRPTTSAAGLSGTYDLVSFSTLGGPVYAEAFAVDNYGTTGGQQLGEVLVYDRPLTCRERLDIEAYLMKKWFDAATPGYGTTAIGSLAVADGARAEIDGELALDGLSGNGTVEGDLTLNNSAVITASAAGGALSGLTVDGTVTVAGGGTVALEGDAGSLAPGLYAVLSCTTLSGAEGWLAGWSLTGAPAKYAASLTADDTGLYLLLSPKGTLMLMR